MVAATAAQWSKALEKATKLGGGALVTKVADGEYDVRGTSTTYHVTETPDTMICNCSAGQHERHCYHVAAVHEFKAGCNFRFTPKPVVKPQPTYHEGTCRDCKKASASLDKTNTCPKCLLWG